MARPAAKSVSAEARKTAAARRRKLVAGVLAALLAAVVAASANSSPRKAAAPSATPQRGGSITVLNDIGYSGSWPAGLDPATNTNGAADQSYMSSIYGQLFELGAGGKVLPDLATGWRFSNHAKDVTVYLRKGVTFSDGTPFNASAVIWNVNRDFYGVGKDCSCLPQWKAFAAKPVITKAGPYAVVFHLTVPYAAFIHSLFDANVSWIASPSAYKNMGEQAFKVKPVGAGPFTVVSDTLNSELVLKRNPHYWKSGRPYLNRIIFKSISGDESALEAMQAGQAQAYEDMSTPSLVGQARTDGFTVTQGLGTSPYDIQLNTSIPPFNNKQARLAIYYATDPKAIVHGIFNDMYPITQGFTGPGGLFYQPTVPGYPAYNPAKARQIVNQLGGLTVNLGTINILVAKQTITALQSMWQAVGMKVTIQSYDLQPLIQAFIGGKWQAMLQTDGSWDPAAGVGVEFRFLSTSPFSGVHDKTMDAYLNAARGTTSTKKRANYYAGAAKYMADQAYGPNLFAFAPANIAVKKLVGPGLTTPLPAVVVTPSVLWEEVGFTG